MFVVFANIGKLELTPHTGYNVVFVMDTSGSLESVHTEDPPTDPNKLRIEGLGKFLSKLPGSGSRVGLVTFNTHAEAFEKNLRLMQTSDVQAIYDEVVRKNEKLGKYTNITEALHKAADFFTPTKGLDPSLPKLILLFTDGMITLEDSSRVADSTFDMRIQKVL